MRKLNKIIITISILLIAINGFTGIEYTIGTGTLTGTVLDTTTGLRWTRCSMASSNIIDISTDCSTTHALYTWEGAIAACEALELAGIDTWRLPNIKELQSIISYQEETTPMIHKDTFPNSKSTYYWSSTSYNKGDIVTDASNYAWLIDFHFGNSLYWPAKSVPFPETDTTAYVRCVTGP